ncbi:unnamed protein product, partial [Effrenium voratum]
QGSWASESAENIWAPRFVSEEEEFAVFALGYPDLELVLEVRGNVFSLLAELFRAHLGRLSGAWLGACGAWSAAELARRKWTFVTAWLFGALMLELAQAPALQLPFRVALSLLGLSLAYTSRRLTSAAAACCRRCLPGRAARGWQPLSFLVFLIAASLQPAGCFLMLMLTSIVALARTPDAQALLATASLLFGPYLLCHLPSLILAVWLLLGQQREASAPFLQPDLDKTLPSSMHAASLWADSWILEQRPEYRWGIFLPALGLVAPAASICFGGAPPCAPSTFAPILLLLSIAASVYAFPCTNRLWWASQPLLALLAACLGRKA